LKAAHNLESPCSEGNENPPWMAQADPGSISCAMPVTPMDGASGPPVHALSLESILFPEPASQLPEASGGTLPTNRSARPLDMVQLLDGDFANTTCGASLGAMETGVIPHSPDNFVRLMSKPLQSRPLASPPPSTVNTNTESTLLQRCQGVVGISPRRLRVMCRMWQALRTY
jgi:hypothetical protein